MIEVLSDRIQLNRKIPVRQDRAKTVASSSLHKNDGQPGFCTFIPE